MGMNILLELHRLGAYPHSMGQNIAIRDSNICSKEWDMVSFYLPARGKITRSISLISISGC